MNVEERRFILSRFSEYYSAAEFNIKSIERREFGVGNSKKIDSRHLAFGSASEFRGYLTANTPFFVSHSAAYYHFPAATPIEKKQRIGADLIFDLDLHAEGKYAVYPKLEEVKQDAVRLLEEFLLGDFGVSKKDVLVVFSGNRGYHIHVRDDEYLLLDGDARREIVNYIRGEGLRYEDFFEWEEVARHKKLYGPRPDEGGYRGRIARMVTGDPSLLAPRIFSKETQRKMFIDGIGEGDWSRSSMKLADIPGKVCDAAKTLPVLSVNADAAVTHDLSKLIRVPNSIHGETGFIAKVVDDIGKFEPLEDALLGGKNNLKTVFSEDVPQLEIAGSTHGPFTKGQNTELPEAVALFYVLKGSASIAF
ncbi:DNA primase catalytic subunit PriS [Candidatus Micrarchaeota archaeon]|nr:DNA primase catalytic subunit PriS [Candidatus Micrarchaeota archaeon]